MDRPSPKCPNCGSRMILKDGSYVCAEFEGYKNELQKRKLSAEDFVQPASKRKY